jgi:hypothetical protein
MKALPRMEAHILDGPHFLLETHATECAMLMGAFVRRVQKLRSDLLYDDEGTKRAA